MCSPALCLVLYGDANDTELPGVEFNVKEVTVSVLWRPMLSMFYGEAEYQKWARKVCRQQAPPAWDTLISEGLLALRAYDEGDLLLTGEFLLPILDRLQKEEDDQSARFE